MKHEVSLPQRARSATPTNVRMFRSRQALRRALLTLLERKRYDQVTIRDIVAEARIGYATFFRHHASKHELLNEIATDQIGKLMSAMFPLVDPTDTHRVALATCLAIDKQRSTWAALLGGGAAEVLRREFVRVTTEWAPHFPEKRWLPIEMGVASGVAACFEILAWWLKQPPGKYSADEVADYIEALVVVPLTLSERPAKRATKSRRK